MGKYDHWFWNSTVMNKTASLLTKLNSWIWWKQYGPK